MEGRTLAINEELTSQSGALQLVFLVSLLVLLTAGLGIASFAKYWRLLMETQLRLDRCVGEKARELSEILNSIEKSNRRICELRNSQQDLEPESRTEFQVHIQSEVGNQQGMILKWRRKQAKWKKAKGCGQRGDQALPLRSLSWTRDPPDLYGAQSLRWEGSMPHEVLVQLNHVPRAAAAMVRRVTGDEAPHVQVNEEIEDEKEGSCSQPIWKADWSVPRK
jgi:hypothetical protein